MIEKFITKAGPYAVVVVLTCAGAFVGGAGTTVRSRPGFRGSRTTISTDTSAGVIQLGTIFGGVIGFVVGLGVSRVMRRVNESFEQEPPF